MTNQPGMTTTTIRRRDILTAAIISAAVGLLATIFYGSGPSENDTFIQSGSCLSLC